MKRENAELSLIAEIGDGAHASLKRVKSGIPYLTAKNITKNGISYSNIDFISEETYEKYFKEKSNALTKPQKNDILYSIIGSIGGVYCVKDEKIGISSSVAIIRANSELILPQYLAYFLKSKFFEAQVQAIKGGVAQGFMSIEKLKIVNILYPKNLDYQAKIVSILSAYDDLIENNQKQIKLLEEAAQRLYKEWFVDLRFPGYETTPIIDGVPEGWRKSFVGECAIILRRGISPAYHENGKFTVINQKCIRQTVVDFDEARKQEKAYSDDLNLLDSDTVICSTGAGTLGRVGQIFGNHPKTTFDSHITLVRANEMIGKQYLFHVLKSYQNYLRGMGKGSTNQLELSRNTIQELTVYVPTFELKIKFEALVQPIHDKISLLNKKIKYLYEARDRLLPKLMSGELEV